MTVFRPVLPWRTRPAVWLTVPAVVAAAVFAARFVDRSDFLGYWPAVVGAAATFLLFSCTLAGVAAAVEASRMRRSRLDQTPTARSTSQVLLLLLGPCYLAGVLVQLAAIIGLSIGTWGAPGQPPILLLTAYAAILAMHTALGYTLGRVLPLPAALPIAVIASFVWLGFTGSTTFFGLRWLAGYALNSCCDPAYELLPPAAAAAIVFSILATIALLFFARPRNARPTRTAALQAAAISAAVLVTAAVLGLAVAPNTSEAADPRAASQTRCHGEHPTVCLFPEQLAGTGNPTWTLARAAANLDSAGITTPETLTAAVEPPRGALSLVVQINEPPADLIHSLVASSLPDPSTGSDCSEPHATEAATFYAVAEHWLTNIASTGLVIATSVPMTSGDTGAAEAIRLAAVPRARQLAWLRHNITAMGRCTTPLRKLPRP